MIIANQYRRTNIAEYVLYMWQLEDTLRAFKLDYSLVETHIVSRYQQDDVTIKDIGEWYKGLIDLMVEEGIKEKGHLQMVTNIVNDVNQFHLFQLQEATDKQYMQLYSQAKANMDIFRSKLGNTKLHDVEICFIALYDFLLLKLQKKEVSEGTQEAMTTFSHFLAYLSVKYLKDEKGEEEQ